jgi:hypothetical protein
MNTFDFIIKYEAGEVTDAQFVRGFANLVKTGLAWTLQGHYGRTAWHLIEGGRITKDGKVCRKRRSVS